jgi:dTDP-glucose pyrophosphorylase
LAGVEDFLLSPGESALGALSALRANGLGIGVVVDGDRGILGTVLDSDIRQAALRDDLVEASVIDVMSDRAVVGAPSASEDELADLMRTHRVAAIPIVEDGVVVAVHALTELEQRPPPIGVIMAGGRGERLRPVTDKVPKPLLKVGSRSIAERLIGGLAAAGVREVFLAVNYKAEIFEQRLGTGEDLGVTLRYLHEEHELGTAGPLALLPETGRAPVIVSNGDIVTTLDFRALREFHWRHAGAITLTGVHHLSHIPYGVLRTVEHHLLEIDEKPERRDLCSAGVYMLEPDVLPFVSPGEPLTMPDLVSDVLAAGLPVNVFPILEKWFDIGGTAEFERVLVQFATGEEE